MAGAQNNMILPDALKDDVEGEAEGQDVQNEEGDAVDNMAMNTSIINHSMLQ